MRKLIAALFLLATTSAFAHGGHVHNILGTVKTLEASSIVLQKTDGSNVTVVLTDSTKYEMAGQPATSADLVAGARVSVHVANDSRTAVTVKIAAPKKN